METQFDSATGLDRGDILVTAGFLRAKHKAGAMKTPLSVELSLPGREQAAWELEAIRYLNACKAGMQAQRVHYTRATKRLTPSSLSPREWEKLSEQWGRDG